MGESDSGCRRGNAAGRPGALAKHRPSQASVPMESGVSRETAPRMRHIVTRGSRRSEMAAGTFIIGPQRSSWASSMKNRRSDMNLAVPCGGNSSCRRQTKWRYPQSETFHSNLVDFARRPAAPGGNRSQQKLGFVDQRLEGKRTPYRQTQGQKAQFEECSRF